jgi:hypothetical protein
MTDLATKYRIRKHTVYQGHPASWSQVSQPGSFYLTKSHKPSSITNPANH